MSKTIKVIDLLNKIANGEEVPIEIEYRNKRYILNRTCKQYYEKGKGSYLDNKLAFKNTIEYEFYGDFLNDEVKIIEGQIIEEQEEIDIQQLIELENYKDTEYYDCRDIQTNRGMINLLVQAVKQLDKKIKEKK